MDIKLKNTRRSILFLLPLLAFGCGSLNKDAKSLYINETINSQSKMSIKLEDNSGFSMDLQTVSNDSLVLERKGLDNLIFTKAQVKVIIEPNTSAAITNTTKRNIKVRIRVYDHNAKVIHTKEAIKP